jgi:hypothetical protein
VRDLLDAAQHWRFPRSVFTALFLNVDEKEETRPAETRSCQTPFAPCSSLGLAHRSSRTWAAGDFRQFACEHQLGKDYAFQLAGSKDGLCRERLSTSISGPLSPKNARFVTARLSKHWSRALAVSNCNSEIAGQSYLRELSLPQEAQAACRGPSLSMAVQNSQ